MSTIKTTTAERLVAFYPHLTARAETHIKRLMATPDDIKNTSAFGVWVLWNDLTFGYQKDADSERLEALLRTDTKSA